MLVIDRKTGESILIGKHGDIRIKVLQGYSEGSYRIGIEAPVEIPIFREEKFRPQISQDLHQLLGDKNQISIDSAIGNSL